MMATSKRASSAAKAPEVQGGSYAKPAGKAARVRGAPAKAPAPKAERRHVFRRRTADRLPVVDADQLITAVSNAVAKTVAAMIAPAQPKQGPQAALGAALAPAPHYPEASTVTAQLWAMYDKEGPALAVHRAKELAVAHGLNEHSATIAFYNWRKYHSIK